MGTTGKAEKRLKVKYRIRKRLEGTASRPRLSVFRSNKSVYCQIIDDVAGKTLCHATSLDKSVNGVTKIEQAKQVGLIIAKKAKDLNLEDVVFDRNGFLYHGRIKAIADGAREGGLKF